MDDTTPRIFFSPYRHAEDGVNTCAFCGFENLRRFLFCRLCTKPIAHEGNSSNNNSTAAASSHATSSSNTDKVQVKKTSVSEKRAPGRTVDRRQRQLRARQRRQWVRKVDVHGEPYWFRQAVAKGSSRGNSNAISPEFSKGCVPSFTRRAVEIAHKSDESKQLGSTGGHPPSLTKASLVDALNKNAASVHLEVVDTAKANPERLSVQIDNSVHDDDNDGDNHSNAKPEPGFSSDNEASDSLRETLAMASSGFLTKFTHFAKAAEELVVSVEGQLVRITVAKDPTHVLEDSMELLAVVPRESVHCKFDVHFTDFDFYSHTHGRYEEWLDLLDDALADPASGVFRPVGKATEASSSLKKQAMNLYLNPDSLTDIGDHHLLLCHRTIHWTSHVEGIHAEHPPGAAAAQDDARSADVAE